MKTRIKICGITNIEDAVTAVEAGADALGFVFANSPRRISPSQVREIISALPPFLVTVGVFVDSPKEEIERVCAVSGINVVQLHGHESQEFIDSLSKPVTKVFRVKDNSNVKSLLADYRLRHFLLDTYDENNLGGTGKSFNWTIAQIASAFGRVILSGGLNPENIRQALTVAKPYAVDVSSGVELSPGVKDKLKIQQFINEVRQWDSQITQDTLVNTADDMSPRQ
ncbi:MAG: phosphoribosylanthranilate isomerase [candidate division Zixibacteria bacterium]|nr:phosphoribosylanthranilate isomerase [candidate division Zixibacteria bacterium]